MHFLPILPNIVAAVEAACNEVDVAKSDDGKIDAGEAVSIIGKLAIALLTGYKEAKKT